MKPICVAQQTENANKQRRAKTTEDSQDGRGNAHNLNNYFDFNAGTRSRPVVSQIQTHVQLKLISVAMASA